jgi:hypothetical protein
MTVPDPKAPDHVPLSTAVSSFLLPPGTSTGIGSFLSRAAKRKSNPMVGGGKDVIGCGKRWLWRGLLTSLRMCPLNNTSRHPPSTSSI